MYILKSIKIKKSKKIHTCNFCGLKIGLNKPYIYDVCVQDGDMYIWKSHIHCTTFCEKTDLYKKTDNYITSDDFVELVRQTFHSICELDKDAKLYNYTFEKMLHAVLYDYKIEID